MNKTAQEIYDRILEQIQVDDHFRDAYREEDMISPEQYASYIFGLETVLDIIEKDYGVTNHSDAVES